jgi:hypothetical protein
MSGSLGGKNFACRPPDRSKDCLLLSPLPDAPRRDLRVARRLAAFRRLAPVDAAGEAIDQPHIVIDGALHADEPRTNRRNQRGQQNSRGDDGRADQYRYRGSRAIRHDRAMPLIIALSFRGLKQGQLAALTLVFLRTIFLETHLADFLFAHRRSGDRFATGLAAEPPGNALEERARQKGLGRGLGARANTADAGPMPRVHTNSMRA